MNSGTPTAELLERFVSVRQATLDACRSLSPEDMQIQSMPDASPTKWHLAHTTWFFETFVLSDLAVGQYSPFHPSFNYLFNSYYNAIGERHPRASRGLLSRPAIDEVFGYRRHVEQVLLESIPRLNVRDVERLKPIIELGLHHEQQHLELLFTDIKHAFAQNPLRPAMRDNVASNKKRVDLPSRPVTWLPFDAGLHHVGHAENEFSFDNELPSHRVFIEPFEVASRPITCGEYRAFIEDGGYTRAELWLSDGWHAKVTNAWQAPLYWEKHRNEWQVFTLHGLRPVLDSEPVCHLSLYEADAFARWAEARLPTEFEWEVACGKRPATGTMLEDDCLHPQPAFPDESGPQQMIGEVWEWTQSAYQPYPGYRASAGALGEYNGKFMCNQMVLRGGSCVTPRSHIRPTYRNFFPPEARWQFTGLRLARSI